MDTATATKPSFTIKRRFKAPPAKVYAAWTDPQMIVRWFGPQGIERVERIAEDAALFRADADDAEMHALYLDGLVDRIHFAEQAVRA